MTLTLDVDREALAGEAEQELGRILRHWAGNLKHSELSPRTSETIMDSTNNPVGTWRIAASNA